MHRSLRRATWSVIAPAMRLSFDRARDGGATQGEKVTLAAIHHLLATYQRLEDRVSLGQIAREEGLWDGAAAECPKSIRNAIGQRLKRLAKLGAIEYEPARYRGERARIGLPRAPEISREALPPQCLPAPEGIVGSAERHCGERRKALWGASKGIAPAMPSEGFSEDVVRGKSPEGACDAKTTSRDVGSLAARLAAVATTNGAVTDREAERVAELLLEFFPPDVAVEVVTEAAAECEIRRPGVVLGAIEYIVDDEGAVERIQADRRFDALYRGVLAVAIADACPGEWVEHLEEAVLVEAHLGKHAPLWVREELLAAVQTAPLGRPGHAEGIARRLLDDSGIDLPKLDLPPARKIRRRRIP